MRVAQRALRTMQHYKCLLKATVRYDRMIGDNSMQKRLAHVRLALVYHDMCVSIP